jgi:hypothetical protein
VTPLESPTVFRASKVEQAHQIGIQLETPSLLWIISVAPPGFGSGEVLAPQDKFDGPALWENLMGTLNLTTLLRNLPETLEMKAIHKLKSTPRTFIRLEDFPKPMPDIFGGGMRLTCAECAVVSPHHRLQGSKLLASWAPFAIRVAISFK